VVNALTLTASVVFVLVMLNTPVNAEVRLGIHTPGVLLHTTLTSYSELHQSKLIRQGWDSSCGAAAMAIIMTFHHLKPVSEAAVALTLLKNTDPDRVRQRGGFSLLDLKRYSEAVGLQGSGLGGMTLSDLKTFALPAILPIRIRGFDHFVVYRQQIGNRIFIGDPAFGNLTLQAEDFMQMWQSKIAFYVLTPGEQEIIANTKKSDSVSPMSPEQSELAIPNLQYSNHLIQRLPINPLTRLTQRIRP